MMAKGTVKPAGGNGVSGTAGSETVGKVYGVSVTAVYGGADYKSLCQGGPEGGTAGDGPH